MYRPMRLAILLLALVPGFGQAQTPDEQVARSLERARQAGVPLQLLESKIAEGRAKGVPMARIATAVDHRLEVLLKVQTTLGERHRLDAAELGVAADALQVGVSEAVLQAIADRAPHERRAVAIAALSQLVQLGHTPEAALLRVTEALQRGPEALMNLPAQAAAAAGRQGPPSGTPAGGAAAGEQGRGGSPATVPGKPDKPRGRPGGGGE